VLFDEPTPHALIAALGPDVLVKGADWAADAIVGRDLVEARGGCSWCAVRSRPLLDERHRSEIRSIGRRG